MISQKHAQRTAATGGIFCLIIASGLVAARRNNNLMTMDTANPKSAAATKPAQMKSAAPTAQEARQFVEGAENRLLPLWVAAQRAAWVQETFITPDTEEMAAEADQSVKAATAELAAQARRYEGLQLPEDLARKLKLIKFSVDIPAPRDTAESTELSQLNASLQSDYGKGKWCPDGPQGKCLSLNNVENLMATSRDPKELERAWEGWHAIAPPMRKRYARMVELANKGARETGFADVGAMWRSNYDMAPDAFGRGTRPSLAAGSTALCFAARLRSLESPKEIWSRCGQRRPSDSRAVAGKYVVAGLDQYLSAGGARKRRSRLRSNRDFESQANRTAGNGALR